LLSSSKLTKKEPKSGMLLERRVEMEEMSRGWKVEGGRWEVGDGKVEGGRWWWWWMDGWKVEGGWGK
jgi:hypothetical protein